MSDIEQAEAVWSDQGKINGQSTQDSALACAKALWSEEGK
jgi:hypothetical protein